MSDDNGFNEGLALWLQKQLKSVDVPVVVGNEFIPAQTWTCGEGTCDNYEAAQFEIAYIDPSGSRNYYCVDIEGHGFGKLVKEIAELMP